jgi:predicted nucleic acid-binding protein
VVDSGPLVAIVRAQEEAHAHCVSALKAFQVPLLTCWPVLTETAWLLREEPAGMRAVLGLVQSGAVQVVELDEHALVCIVAFMERFAAVGAQLADAALVSIADAHGVDTVFTLDRRGFSVYRLSSGKALAILPEL